MASFCQRLPPELWLHIVSYLSIPDIHAFQRISKLFNSLICLNESLIYKAAAIHHGFAPATVPDLQTVTTHRKRKFDWLSGVKTWLQYCKLHVDIENNWSANGHAVHYVVCGSGVSPHRIKIDEEEGMIIVTHELGMLLTSSLLGTVLWTCRATRYAHCEFDHGFLILTGHGGSIEVWRRETDHIASPLPVYAPSDEQLAARADSSASPGSSSPAAGAFMPLCTLQTPRPTRATRFVYPTLAVVTGDGRNAYLYDVPNATLIQTINIHPAGSTINEDVRYVEIGARHVFICTVVGLRIISRESGKVISTINPAEMPIPDMASLTWSWPYELHDEKFLSQRVSSVGENKKEIVTPPGPFYAVHVSPCGKHFVSVTQNGYVLLVPNFEQAIKAEGDQAKLKGAGYVLKLNTGIVYMAFDGKRIVLATDDPLCILNLDNDYHLLPPYAAASPTPKVSAPETYAAEAFPKFPVKHRLVHEYHLESEWDLEGCSCLQMSDTSVWFVVPNAGQPLFRSVHCIEFAPSGHRINRHAAANNMQDGVEEEIDEIL